MTDSIEKILANLKPEDNSTFCSKVVTALDDLQIQVKGVGDLRLPLKPRIIKSLIKQSRPAKYGLKEQTLLDKKVRDVWEIPKSRVKINQRHWKKSFDAALLQLKTSLGLSEQSKLKAELHNLIIYEPGQFFKPHQDSEKCDDMVATLVVILPSFYRGGTLIVDHQDEKKRFTSRSSPEDKLTFIAFYADCHHEVRPVTEGYRVALTYNLTLKSGVDFTNSHSDSASQEKLASALSEYFENNQSDEPQYLSSRATCKKFAYLLDHEYTAKGLHWSRLKNNDRTRVNAFREVANKLDMDIYLGLIDVHESWECQDDTDWGYGRRHRYWEYEEEIKIENEQEDEYTLGELLFTESEFKSCMDIQGNPINMSGLLIRDNEIFCTKEMEEFKPFESEYEGYMGNWGNTMDRWYHRAAIILWRKIDHHLMLLECSPTEFLNKIFLLAKKKAEHKNVQRIVTHILPSWRGLRNDDNSRNLSRVLQLALIIDNPESATQLVNILGEKAVCKETTNELIELANTYGVTWCTKNMHTWLLSKYGMRKEKLILVDPLLPIIKILVSDSSKNSSKLASWLLKHQLDALKQAFDSDAKTYQQAELDAKASNRVKILTDLMQASLVTKAFPVYDELVLYTIKNKNIFPAVEITSAILKTHRYTRKLTLAKQQYIKLKTHALNEINSALNSKPRSSNDWSIKDKNLCNCGDCQVLNKFLLDSSKQKMIWPLAKKRRQHIHHVVNNMKLPVTHTTERAGSPHKLHLTKTEQLFKREASLRDKYKKALVSLEKHDS